MTTDKHKNSSEFIDISELVAKYIRHWKWFAVSLFCMMALAFVYLKKKDKVYLLEANILIKPEDASPQSKMAGGAMMKTLGLSGLASSENTEDEASILGSQSLFRKMIIDLGINTYYELNKFPFDKSLYKTNPIVLEADRTIIDTLQTPLKFTVKVGKDNRVKVRVKAKRERLGTFRFDGLPAKVNTPYGDFMLRKNIDSKALQKTSYSLDITLLGADLAAEIYRKNIAISPYSKRSNMINLQVEDPIVSRGKEMLNTLISLYNLEALGDKNKIAQNSADFIQKRLEYISDDLSKIELEIEQYKKINQMTDISMESKLFLERMSDLREKTYELETRKNMLTMMEDYLQNPVNKHALIPMSIDFSEGLVVAVEKYNEAVLERNRLLRTTHESNPVIENLSNDLEQIRQNVFISIRNAGKELVLAKSDWKAREKEVLNRVRDIPTKEREYIDLARQQKLKSEMYVFLLERLEEAQLSLASTTPKAKIVDNAFNYNKPVSPKIKIVLAIALALALFLPILAIYLKDLLRNRIADSKELENNTSLPLLGEICTHDSEQKIVITPSSYNSISELFRLLRTNLQFTLTDKAQKVILLTSTESNEGKSFVAANLALALSHIKDKKVVVVGLDIRNPSLPEFFDVMNRDKGVTTYLSSDEYSEKEIIFSPTNIDTSLSVIPSGPIPPNPAELLLGDRLDKLFDYLRAHFDYIVVDSAPVGMVSDTFSLNRVMDICLYVFRANKSPKGHLKYAEQIVKEGRLKKVYLALNDTKMKKGYGYGYGSDAMKKREK